jgi:hypothetical protein
VLHEESLVMCRELGHKKLIALALDGLGLVAHEQGDYARATLLYEESLTLWRELGDRWGVAISLDNLGRAVHGQGDEVRARMLYGESLALMGELGDRHGIVYSLEGLALVATTTETTPAALERVARLLDAAAALRAAIGAPQPPNERAGHERSVAALRAVLGEVAFEAAWAAGRALSLEQAIAYALEGTPPGSGTPGGTE